MPGHPLVTAFSDRQEGSGGRWQARGTNLNVAEVVPEVQLGVLPAAQLGQPAQRRVLSAVAKQLRQHTYELVPARLHARDHGDDNETSPTVALGQEASQLLSINLLTIVLRVCFGYCLYSTPSTFQEHVQFVPSAFHRSLKHVKRRLVLQNPGILGSIQDGE